jgi:4-amino-4-deoxy-L-arabinose transferase-like glycosyltransferase
MVQFPVMQPIIVRPARTRTDTGQPYIGPTATAPLDLPAPKPALRRADLRSLAIILAGFVAVLLILPPQHEYPIIDDWIYASSVRDLLSTGRFIMPSHSQANLVGLTLWGALWVKLFGFSFTTLTYSTLVMALAGLYAFYGIARAVNVPLWGALLGTGLLLFNPLFVQLSYSFMTDVPFLALVLISCYCYIRGVQKDHLGWLVLGGLFAGWSFLIRQFGLLVPVAFFLYIAANGLLTGKWRWRQLIVTALVPAIIFGGWAVWARDIPESVSAYEADVRRSGYVFKEPWLRVFLLRAFNVLPLTALFAWAAVKLPRGCWWLFGFWLAVLGFGMHLVALPTEIWINISEPPFTGRLGPFSYDFPQQSFSFGTEGNVLQVGGISFFQFRQQPIWTPEAWRAIWLFGLLLAALLLAKMTASLFDWLKLQRNKQPLPPLVALYLLGVMVFAVSLAFAGDIFDRYILGFLPFLVLFVVRGSFNWGRRAWIYSVATLAVLATFTLLAKADQIEHDNVRWQAGQWMAQRVGLLHVGYDWDYWMGESTGVYEVTDVHIEIPGLLPFRTEHQFPYLCRLCGFTTRYVLAEARSDAPALPPGP